MRNAARLVFNNLGSTILALLLSFAVWITATMQDDPFQTREFTNVPLIRLGQPSNTILLNAEQVPERVAITVRAPESMLQDLRVSEFEATMDLSTLQPGEPAPVTIQVTTTAEAIRIESVTPPSQQIHLEEMRTISLPVEVEVVGQVATGYQASFPVIVPDEIAIYGPAPYLTEIVTVTGSINVEGAKDNITKQATVTPLDAGGKLIPGLELDPRQVSVSVNVRKRLGFKPEVQVVPDLRGEPAPGYRMGSVTVEPSTVTLAGLQSVLDSLPGFVETMPISVTGAIEDLSQRSTLTMPTNVVVYGVNYVTVTVEILAIQSSRAMTGVVEVQGIQPSLVATPSPDIVDIILEGPDAILADLQPDELQIILNLFDYPLGVHRLEPEVLAPTGVTVVSVIPETIEVVIAPAPTPTPTLTDTAAITATPTVTVTVTAEP